MRSENVRLSMAHLYTLNFSATEEWLIKSLYFTSLISTKWNAPYAAVLRWPFVFLPFALICKMHTQIKGRFWTILDSIASRFGPVCRQTFISVKL